MKNVLHIHIKSTSAVTTASVWFILMNFNDALSDHLTPKGFTPPVYRYLFLLLLTLWPKTPSTKFQNDVALLFCRAMFSCVGKALLC